MITRRLSVFKEKPYLSLIDLIRSADVSFTNLEMLLHRYESYPTGRLHIGTYMAAEPYLAEELKWAGFNLVSCAMNHAGDYSHGGMLSTMDALEKAGLVYAGMGSNLGLARSPAYLETARGRVALIAGCSTFQPWEKAGEVKSDCPGRPGINGLTLDTVCVVDDAMAENLKELSRRLGHDTKTKGDEFSCLGKRFRVGSSCKLELTLNQADVEANLRSIRDAKRQAEWVLYSFHSHEGEGTLEGTGKGFADQFCVDFAHNCIDAGADMFIGHGAHVLRGIEVYREKPIFYSLGNFIAQNETIKHLPSDIYDKLNLPKDATPADVYDARWGTLPPIDPAWWESVLAVSTFDHHKLVSLKLYPLTLGFRKPRSQRGRPLLAQGEEASGIIKRLSELSERYGTKIEFDKGVGTVKLQ
jgi:poly-gamma-glutamate synthesis protein (capsule biosynthesis protein)